MNIIEARRVVAFRDSHGMTFEQLARHLHCSESEARDLYGKAKGMCDRADVRKAVQQVIEFAARYHVSPESLVGMYA